MPDRMPEGMPDKMSDRMPEDMPDRMPEDMSVRMPEDMSDRMPEDLPVRKCKNVTVGITRSKVILNSHSPYFLKNEEVLNKNHLAEIFGRDFLEEGRASTRCRDFFGRIISCDITWQPK